MTHRQLMLEDSEQNISGRGNAWTFLLPVMIHTIRLRTDVDLYVLDEARDKVWMSLTDRKDTTIYREGKFRMKIFSCTWIHSLL